MLIYIYFFFLSSYNFFKRKKILLYLQFSFKSRDFTFFFLNPLNCDINIIIEQLKLNSCNKYEKYSNHLLRVVAWVYGTRIVLLIIVSSHLDSHRSDIRKLTSEYLNFNARLYKLSFPTFFPLFQRLSTKSNTIYFILIFFFFIFLMPLRPFDPSSVQNQNFKNTNY